MLFPFALITVITFVKCDNQMMIVWGKPSSFNPVPQFYQNIDWPACIQTCYEYQSCVKTNSTEGSIVAFKIYSTENRTDYVCPNGINAPTFNNKNATGYLYLDSNPDYYPEKVWYNISLTGSLWTLSYNWAPLCQFGYYGYYDNPDGTWCAMFLSSNLTKQNIGVNYDATACQRFGALFPTINYPVDAQVIPVFLNRSHVDFMPNEQYYIRIDGVRTKACQSAPKTASCMTAAGFTFTDSRFKGNLNNYGWATNAGARSGSDDDCLVLVYPPIGGNVKVDVRSCTTLGTIKSLGSFCVRRAFT